MSNRRLSLRAKLLGAFAAVLALTVAVGLVSLSKMQSLQDETKNVSTFVLPAWWPWPKSAATSRCTARTSSAHRHDARHPARARGPAPQHRRFDGQALP
jgi:hypothetical protein